MAKKRLKNLAKTVKFMEIEFLTKFNFFFDIIHSIIYQNT